MESTRPAGQAPSPAIHTLGGQPRILIRLGDNPELYVICNDAEEEQALLAIGRPLLRRAVLDWCDREGA